VSAFLLAFLVFADNYFHQHGGSLLFLLWLYPLDALMNWVYSSYGIHGVTVTLAVVWGAMTLGAFSHLTEASTAKGTGTTLSSQHQHKDHVAEEKPAQYNTMKTTPKKRGRQSLASA
jgi:hypothetical protein